MRVSLNDNERLLRTVPEAAWTQQVIELARVTGWLLHHSRTALMRSGKWATALAGAPGMPDLILVRPPRLIVAELKRQHGGVLSPGQEQWLEAFRGIPGVEVYVWRPGDREQVYETLKEGGLMEKCPFCGALFTSGKERGAHIRAVHDQAFADVMEETARQAYEKVR